MGLYKESEVIGQIIKGHVWDLKKNPETDDERQGNRQIRYELLA